ncbi:MAG: hypothetical protein M1136_05350 [Chloroflexi bacterium]|nr:hypothetical protein [Chloroflexota bacterium]MCL5075063.1 hypothetical protein [Chloroflexota bacterium]
MEDWLSLLAPYSGMLSITVAALLTLLVFTYLWRDNAAYRVAEHVFVGASIGYVTVVIYHQVLLPRVIQPFSEGRPIDWSTVSVPAILGLLFLTKLYRPIGWMGNFPLAIVVGVGSALILCGTLAGTLVPQIGAAAVSLEIGDLASPAAWQQLAGNTVMFIGVVGGLCYFYFTAGDKGVGVRALRISGTVGKWIIMISFGALFASLAVARVSLLIGRLNFLLGDWLGLIR